MGPRAAPPPLSAADHGWAARKKGPKEGGVHELYFEHNPPPILRGWNKSVCERQQAESQLVNITYEREMQ